MTRVALISRKKEIVQETPNFNARKFRYYLSRANYQKEWGKGYRKPTFGTRVLAFFLRIVPKIGPFKAVDFKIPTKQTEDLYIASVDSTLDNYKQLLRQAGAKDFQLPDTDFDTGHATQPGEYALADATYAQLLDKLAGHNFDRVTLDLRSNILAFYSDPNAALATKRKAAAWQKTQDEIRRLKGLPNAGKSAALIPTRSSTP
jgi:hypothetical protein